MLTFRTLKLNNITLSLLLVSLSSSALAETWNGSVSDDWFEGNNWSPNTIPNSTTSAIINNGQVNLSNGASIINQLQLAPASNNNAQLTISDNGHLTMVGTNVIAVGGASGSNGSGKIVVTGNNASLTMANTSLYVGLYGYGELQIIDGGKMYMQNASRGLILADHLSATGIAEVDGQGSLIDIAGNLTVGGDGKGYLNITNGGTVNTHGSYNNYSLLIGGYNGDNRGGGVVVVDGIGSTLNITGDVYIGNTASGKMSVSNGAKVNVLSTASSYLADQQNDVENSVLVTGQGSEWNAGKNLFIGRSNASGALTINDGGKVSVGQAIGVGYGDDNASLASTGINVINIGGTESSAPHAAGYLDAPAIQLFTADNSILNLNHTDNTGDYILAAVIDGNGTINQLAGTTTLTGASSDFAGKTQISGGRLIVNNALGGQVNIAELGMLGGSGVINGNVENAGLIAPGILSSSNVDSPTRFGSGFNTLTVNGDYVSNNGKLVLNSHLYDDNSPTDKLVINGNTSGNTHVWVDNLGGSGAPTLNGIELIQVNGLSDGEFVKSGRIVAGAYDYSLARGIGNNATNWYLTSLSNELVDPENPVNPGEEMKRPEAGSYTANLAAASNMFVTRLHDRLGETQYIDALTGEQKVTSMWLRNEGGHNRSRDTSGQLKTQSNRYVMQLGGDIAQWSNNDLNRLHLGVMAGYGNSKSKTRSKSSYQSDGSVDGYTVGMYSTWYANDEDKSGWYVDGWAQYGWFNNTVAGQDLASEEYKSKGVTASVESGYTFKVGENTAKNASYLIQPKMQMTWMGVKADEHTEANGTHVSGKGDGNIQTRLGVKAFMNGYADQDKGKDRVFQPFVEANWVHNTKDFGTTMDGIVVKQDGAANIGELKLGVEGQLNKKVNVWGNVGQQLGNKGYSDTAVMLGVKYNF